jgi:hypothetical protein
MTKQFVKTKVHVGRSYGRWTVLGHGGEDRKGNILWKVQCLCGKESIEYPNKVKRNTDTTCHIRHVGRIESAKPPSTAIGLYGAYQKAASSKQRSFSLSLEEFTEITQKNCVYCGTKPTQVYRGYVGSGDYIYNGIDRQNNLLGYEYGNCVPCCGVCNRFKGATPYETFMLWIDRILAFRSDSQSD